MFSCPMCDNPEETLYRQPLCSKCTNMKKIVDCYGIDSILDIRTEEPIKNRQICKKKLIKSTSM